MPNMAQPVGGSRDSVMATVATFTAARPRGRSRRARVGKAMEGKAKDGRGRGGAGPVAVGSWLATNDDGFRTRGWECGEHGSFKLKILQETP